MCRGRLRFDVQGCWLNGSVHEFRLWLNFCDARPVSVVGLAFEFPGGGVQRWLVGRRW